MTAYEKFVVSKHKELRQLHALEIKEKTKSIAHRS